MRQPAARPMPPVVAPGFFGKVPSRGDFLSRRVPEGLGDRWEGWLAGLVTAASGAASGGWPEPWLTAPLWHFVLGSAISPPLGAAGVLVASADRVGRLFPFTIIGVASGPPDRSLRILIGWAGRAERLMLAALDDGFDPQALDDALLELGPPPAVAGSARAVGRWHLPLDGDWPSESADPLACSAISAPAPGQSVWYCRGSSRLPSTYLRCDGLPGVAAAAAMIGGASEDGL